MGDRTGKELHVSGGGGVWAGPSAQAHALWELEFSPQHWALLFPCRKWNWTLC